MKNRKRSTFNIVYPTPNENETMLLFVLGESKELIGIFHSSIQTARRNAQAAASTPVTAIRY